jgi:hypothetical protein
MRTWRTIWKNESMRHMQSMGTGKPIVVPLWWQICQSDILILKSQSNKSDIF